jgi:glycosyltransferase involved in cell wall biosynthesis
VCASDIAVVITAHNYGHYLEACLDSVFGQTLLPQEVVVIDDASIDNTIDVVKAYKQTQYFRVDFCNGNRARNFGFSKTSCREIVFFDADNMMMPTFLAQLHEALQQDDSAAFAYCDRINFGTDDVAWYPHPMGHMVVGAFDRDRLLASNYIDLASLIRRDRFPGFDENLRRYQDWDMWLNIVLKQGGHGCYVPEPLFRYRVHGNNVSRREKRDLALWTIRKKYRIGWGRIPVLRHSYWLYGVAGRIKRRFGR